MTDAGTASPVGATQAIGRGIGPAGPGSPVARPCPGVLPRPNTVTWPSPGRGAWLTGRENSAVGPMAATSAGWSAPDREGTGAEAGLRADAGRSASTPDRRRAPIRPGWPPSSGQDPGEAP